MHSILKVFTSACHSLCISVLDVQYLTVCTIFKKRPSEEATSTLISVLSDRVVDVHVLNGSMDVQK